MHLGWCIAICMPLMTLVGHVVYCSPVYAQVVVQHRITAVIKQLSDKNSV